MKELSRFGVSIEKGLLEQFDVLLKDRNYTNRSEALRDLIRKELIQKQWEEGKEIVGAITFVYDHHRRDMIGKITEIQHNFHDLIISAMHVHLDHNNCVEIIAVKGSSSKVVELSNMLRAIKGVKHCTLSMSSTGKEII
ncbi:MAG: nickel-responsive transcriptional regulator NikR [Candidatus Theseobacter exili]|nr:nickel-responsive transcriptional regulator NikR [Candidatus Theseobacter exili]